MEDYKKKYEELMKHIKHFHQSVNPEWKRTIECYIPELKDSEDERMRKGLINTFSVYYKYEPNGEWDGKPVKDIIAWLEKQGKQKSTDEIKPKFKVGDKINRINREEEDYTILTVTSINMDEKCYICNQGSVIDFDEEREWYKIERKPAWSEEEKARIDRIINVLDWAEEKGRISYSDWEDYVTYVKSLKPQSNQKLVWNEEDEKILNSILNDLSQDVIPDDEDIQWLKSLKERYIWKPTDKQMRTLEYYMNVLNCNEYKEVLYGLYEQLKKLMEK